MMHFAKPIRCAMLFGSKARGDSDIKSDTDIAIFAAVESAAELIEVKRRLESHCGDANTNFSAYSETTARTMAEQGSLYLWHLKLEGKLLYDFDEWSSTLFQTLKPYGRAKAMEDLQTFKVVLSDIREALQDGANTAPFEAATVAAILRSLGMMTSALIGRPIFARTGSIEFLRDYLSRAFPFSDSEIQQLLAAKFAYSRNLDQTKLISQDECLRLALRTQDIVHSLEGNL